MWELRISWLCWVMYVSLSCLPSLVHVDQELLLHPLIVAPADIESGRQRES